MTNLPPLPKQNKTLEADFGVTFRAWIESHRELFPHSATFELKQTDGKASLNFSEVSATQIAYGATIEREGALIRVQGMNGEPDYAWMAPDARAYVVIEYPQGFCIIRVSAFVAERNASARKSLTYERAWVIASHVVKTRGPPVG